MLLIICLDVENKGGDDQSESQVPTSGDHVDCGAIWLKEGRGSWRK